MSVPLSIRDSGSMARLHTIGKKWLSLGAMTCVLITLSSIVNPSLLRSVWQSVIRTPRMVLLASVSL